MIRRVPMDGRALIPFRFALGFISELNPSKGPWSEIPVQESRYEASDSYIMSSPFPPLTLASSSTRLAVASGSALHIFTPSSDPTPSPLTSSSSDKSAHSAGLVRHIALSPDRIHAATHGDDKALRVFSIDTDSLKLLSTRTTTKRGSHISFEKNDDILVSDKVGDVYSYPLHPPPSDPKAPRPTATELASDPSRNPDATLLLGHVSIVTTHLITPDGKHIITADRDEHIRVSRYPESYVIERYLLGSNGFVSALHIPPSRPSILLSAGGEAIMRVWDWATGEQIESVEIWPQVLPHRKVRSSMRKIKNPKKRLKLDPSGARGSGTFYDAPEGWLLPSGQGVRVKKIESIDMDGQVVVVFFSEG